MKYTGKRWLPLDLTLRSRFSAKEYLDTYYSSAKGNPNEQGQFEFYSEQQYGFYKRYSFKWNKKTARLLEFGSGAVISNLIIAAPYTSTR